MICHQLGHNELDLSGPEAPGGEEGSAGHLGPNYSARAWHGVQLRPSPRRAAGPRCPLGSPGQTFNEWKWRLLSPRLWPRRAIWVLLAPALKGQSTF